MTKNAIFTNWNLQVKHSPQLAEIIIIDMNSKEHTENKVNQKELRQLQKCFNSFTKIE